jgi:hypothetical protein
MINKNTPVSWLVTGSTQRGHGIAVSDEDGGFVQVAVTSYYGEKPQPDNIRPVSLFVAANLKNETATVASSPAAIVALLVAVLMLFATSAKAGPFYTPLNNVTITGSNTFNLPSLLSYGTNTQFNGSGGYYNSNNLPAVAWTTVNVDRQTLVLYSQNLNTNAQTITVGLVASTDGAHWFQPSTAGGTLSVPNYLTLSIPANTQVSTNAQMYQIFATNFNSYGIINWAVSSVTNANTVGGGTTTNILTLTVSGKTGL